MIEAVKYSVPSTYAGQGVDARIIGEQVAVMAGGLVVAQHARETRRYS